MLTRCRSCGLYDGAHEKDCMAVERAAREKLQTVCDHRVEYGTTRTTGDPLGPPCCGRCGLELDQRALAIQFEDDLMPHGTLGTDHGSRQRTLNMNQYAPIKDLIQLITEPNRTAVGKLFADNRELFSKVQGSTHNHQAWPGGYLDHVTEVMNIAVVLFRTLDAKRPLPFSISDILLVVFLHDIEKPWKYELGEDGHLRHKATMLTKTDHQRFRMEKLAEYGIQLNDKHENGLKYAEGELDDYSSRERKMGPLAALAHLCDVTSARLWFDHPASADDPWAGAKRVSELHAAAG